jgi:hypothetical protein
MKALRFTWAGMGKPDKSHCHKIVGSLPADLRHELTRSDRDGLASAVHILWVHAYRSGRHKAYGYFSEGWLAKSIRMSYRTAQRVVAHLAELGLLKVTNRRPVSDCYQTNIYEPGKRLLAILFGGFRRKTPMNSPCAKNGTQEPKEGNISFSDALILIPKEVAAMDLPTSPGSALDGQPGMSDLVGQAVKGVTKLSDLIAAVMPALRQEAEAKKVNREERLRAYWERSGVLPAR